MSSRAYSARFEASDKAGGNEGVTVLRVRCRHLARSAVLMPAGPSKADGWLSPARCTEPSVGILVESFLSFFDVSE